MITVAYGDGTTEYGPGVIIELDGDDVALAITEYLIRHDIHIAGPRTVRVNDELCKDGEVYVDPSGMVDYDGERFYGRGKGPIKLTH